MATLLSHLVSKQKRRLVEGGYDLDLSYITPRIIALGAPSEGGAAVYRNALPDVRRFFAERHPGGRLRVYDLRAEKGACYEPSQLAPASVCGSYRFLDHSPAPLELVSAACEDASAWLEAHPDNVVAFHCKAGKGRTGLMVSALLVRCGLADDAEAALALFGTARTHNGKGVTIPSQQRYVHYYATALARRGGAARLPTLAVPVPPLFRLRHIRMHGVPNFDLLGGCDPFFVISTPPQNSNLPTGLFSRKIFDWLAAKGGRVENAQPRKQLTVDFDVSPFDVRVRGDVRVSFFDWDKMSSPDKMFSVYFHTSFVSDEYLRFDRSVLDGANKDKGSKHFPLSFEVELFLDRLVDETEGGDGSDRERAGGGGGEDFDHEAEHHEGEEEEEEEDDG